MKISDTQLDEYISLCETTCGTKPERVKALGELQKLLSLLLYTLFPESTVTTLEKELEEAYTKNATHKV
jgi:hypothetical protein